MHNALGLVFRNGAIHGRRDLVSVILLLLWDEASVDLA